MGEDKLDKILEGQNELRVLVQDVITKVDVINSRGCETGDSKRKDIYDRIKTTDDRQSDKIDSIEEKNNRMIIGALGTAMLSLASALGTLFLYKFGK